MTTEKKPFISLLTGNASLQQSIQTYQNVAHIYDLDCEQSGFTGPQRCAEAALRTLPADRLSSIRVLDLCCGTGRVGQLLWDAGVRQLDAVDASSKMLEVARRRGIYSRILHDTVGHHRIDADDNTYDAVVVCAAFMPHHLPVSALDECLRLCKPGGYFINTMRFEFLVTVPEYKMLEPHMDHLERLGRWRCAERIVFDKHYTEFKQGITFIHQKL